MTTNNTQLEKNFEKDLQSVRRISIAPEKKDALFRTLMKYTEAHPAKMERRSLASRLVRIMRRPFSRASWRA